MSATMARDNDLSDTEQQSNTSMSGAKTPDVDDPGLPSGDVVNDDIEKQVHDAKSSKDPGNGAEPKDLSLVEFDGPDDKDNPRNWTMKRRWMITASMGLM